MDQRPGYLPDPIRIRVLLKMREPSYPAHVSGLPRSPPKIESESCINYRMSIPHPVKIKNRQCVNLYKLGQTAGTHLKGQLRSQLLREDGVTVGRRKQLLDEEEAFSQVAAGKLAGPGIYIDIAANAM